MIIGEKRKVCAISDCSPLATSSATHHHHQDIVVSPTTLANPSQLLPPPTTCKPTTSSQISPRTFVKLDPNSSLFSSAAAAAASTTSIPHHQLFAFHQQLMSATINTAANNSSTTTTTTTTAPSSSAAASAQTTPPSTTSSIASSSPTTGNTAVSKQEATSNNSNAINDSSCSGSQQQQQQLLQNNNAKQQQQQQHGNTSVSPQAGGIIPAMQLSPMTANGNKSPTQANNATTQHSPTSVTTLQQQQQNNNSNLQMTTVAQMPQSHQQLQQPNNNNNAQHVAMSPIIHSSSGSGHSPIYVQQHFGGAGAADAHDQHVHAASALHNNMSNIITLDADKDSSGSGTGDRFHHLQPHHLAQQQQQQTNPAAGQKQIQQLQFHNSTASAGMQNNNKKRRRFTKEEDDKIVEAVLKFKDNHKQVDWDKIVEWSKLDRTKEQIRNRYGRIKQNHGNQHPTAVNCSTPAGSLSNSPSPSPQPAAAAASFAPTGGHFGIINSSAAAAGSSAASTSKQQQPSTPSSKSSNFALPQQHHGLPSSSNPSLQLLHVQTSRKQLNSAGTQASAQPVTFSTPYSKSYAPNALPPSPTTAATFFNPAAFPNNNNNASDYQTEDLHEDQPPAKKQKLHHHPTQQQQQQQYAYASTQTGMGGASFANPPALQLHRSPSLSELSNSKSSSGSKLLVPKPDGILRKDAACQTGEDMTVERISRLQEELEDKNKLIKEYDRKLVEYERNLSDMQYALVEQQQKNDQLSSRFKDTLYDLIKERAERERRDDLKRVKENSLRIGSITYQRKGLEVFEVWQDGELFQELDRRLQKISSEKEVIERKKQQLDRQRQLYIEESAAQEAMMDEAGDNNNNSIAPNTNSEFYIDLVEQEEALKIRMAQLKKEEADIAEERQKLMIEKSRQVKELKRIRDEERSRFNNFSVLRERYLLMKLMGRGGFSEVYKAYDLKEMRIVACKIHQLNTNWKEQRKENYIKHVLRECQIHKSIVHPRVVQMFDTFIYDNNTYVTVLEFCDGSDLDLYIKTHQRIPEKEARNVIAQVFSGLHYLNSQNKKVIHFDLKPANILYCSGEIKITDFGLSKIMEEEDQIELTSQGAGTYWYLPPECFEVGKIPKISSKVDVWSAGVVFYQMLFGKKPFGNDLSQQKILSERTITNATDVQFPAKPIISEEAKEFIRKCLTYTQENRPDVHTMYRDNYLRPYIEKEKRMENKFFAAQGTTITTTTSASSASSSATGGLNGTTMTMGGGGGGGGSSASSTGAQTQASSYLQKNLQVKQSVTSPPSSNSLLENVDDME